ncbi:hypothetical protein GCM10022631_37200 [Deinococcus rubellus]
MVLTLATAGAASAQSSAARVVYDSRIQTPEPRLTELERGRVKYLAGLAMEARLWDDADFRASDTCAGQDFAINGVAPGAFTVKGAQQTAYLYMYCYFRPGWSQGLVITQGNQVVAHYVFTNLVSSLYALKDINQNGFTELVLEGGFTAQGGTEGYIEIAELQPQRRLLAQFKYDNQLQPYSDNCGAVETGGIWTSQVIRVTPGKNPQFTAQKIQGKCENERVATLTGALRPLKVQPLPTGWLSAPLR